MQYHYYIKHFIVWLITDEKEQINGEQFVICDVDTVEKLNYI